MNNFLLVIYKKEGNFDFKYNKQTRFVNDFIYNEEGDNISFLTGIVLNKENLSGPQVNSSWSESFRNLYQQKGEKFFADYKGSYNGFIYDRRKDLWIVFSNVQGEKPLFKYESDNEIIISTSIKSIQEHLKGKSLSLSVDGAYMLLTYGYMLESNTLFNEIERLDAGYYYKIQGGKLTKNNFFSFDNIHCTNESEAEIIEHIDHLFREAVSLQFQKDREYNYKHIVTLSGGLDSRMTAWVASDLGFRDQLNVTFAQTNSHDEKIAGKIAASLNNEWLFKALDNGNYLKDIDNSALVTQGNSIYAGVAHSISVYRNLNWDNLGLVHSGQLGDSVISWKYKEHRKPHLQDGIISKKLFHKLRENIIDLKSYENEELYIIPNRFINGANYGLQAIRPYSETFSPFYDIDFWSYCLTLPLKFRYGHLIYKKWIQKKYPKAGDFIWGKTNVPVNYKFWRDKKIFYKGKGTDLIELSEGLYRKIARRLHLPYKPSMQGMNPLESWYLTNASLRTYYKHYFEENISLLNNIPELRDDARMLFEKGKVIEKILVLSLLSSIKYFKIK